MPITASAQKALRQSKKRKAANLRRSNTYKSAMKDLKKATSASPKEAKDQLAKTYQAIDKAAKTGVIKKNKAARLKSSASKLLSTK